MTSPFSRGTTAVSASPAYRGGVTSGFHRPYPTDAIEHAAWFPGDEACADYDPRSATQCRGPSRQRRLLVFGGGCQTTGLLRLAWGNV